jgi:hypothetical protein
MPRRKYYHTGIDYEKLPRRPHGQERCKPHFAQVRWHVEDVIEARKDLDLARWDYSECEDWLTLNEKKIADSLVEHGNVVIRDMLFDMENKREGELNE